jgi:CO/xanthine dehydrogenase FAD-binding subunit
MLLPKFDYYAPTTLDEACSLLSHYGAKARCLAGGTDLLVNLKKKVLAPEQLISLNRINGLSEAVTQNGQGLTLGPLCTAAYLAESGVIQEKSAVLRQGAGKLGSPLIRNRATVGGNLVTARPASDLAPPLLVLGARLILKSSQGERTLDLKEFILGPGRTALRPDEIVSCLSIPPVKEPYGAAYLKLGSRKALEISLVNAASLLSLGPDGTIQEAQVALGAVGPTPLLSPSAEKTLKGARPKDEKDSVFKEAARAAAQDARPITDHRGSADYRRDMVEILTYRTLLAAFQQLRKKI